MSGFTKGPWTVAERANGCEAEIKTCCRDGYEIAETYGYAGLDDNGEDVGSQANAHLIAAAPDGYYMAQGVVEAYEATKAAFVRKALQPHYDAAIAFIAKAEGKS